MLVPNGRQRGLTIVELLSVVAIVGMLMAIILSAVFHFRTRAYEAKCTAQLRQVGMGVLTHATDNSLKTVVAWVNPAEEELANHPQIKLNKLQWFEYLIELGYLPKERDIVVCPAQFPFSWSGGVIPSATMMTYGLRQKVDKYEPAAELDQIENPSKYILLADSSKRLMWGGQQYYISHPGNGADTIHLRHNGRAHVFTADGRVSALNKQEILDLGDGWTLSALDTKPLDLVSRQ